MLGKKVRNGQSSHLSCKGQIFQISMQIIPVTRRWRQLDTVWAVSIRNSSPPWRLSSLRPLEAGAVTAPLPWDGYTLVRPLLCQRRSRSVIFHYCCLSNVSIMATFKSFCSPCHHWDLKISLPHRLLRIYMRDSNLRGVKGKKGTIKPLVCVTLCCPTSLAPFSILHSSSRTPISCKWSILKKSLLMFWRILSILGGLKAQKLLCQQTQEI